MVKCSFTSVNILLGINVHHSKGCCVRCLHVRCYFFKSLTVQSLTNNLISFVKNIKNIERTRTKSKYNNYTCVQRHVWMYSKNGGKSIYLNRLLMQLTVHNQFNHIILISNDIVLDFLEAYMLQFSSYQE